LDVRGLFITTFGKKERLYDTEQKTSNNGCSQQLTLLKKVEWLKEVDKFALQNSLKNLDVAYKTFADWKQKVEERM